MKKHIRFMLTDSTYQMSQIAIDAELELTLEKESGGWNVQDIDLNTQYGDTPTKAAGETVTIACLNWLRNRLVG